jgi:hypothetical protein
VASVPADASEGSARMRHWRKLNPGLSLATT